MPIHRWMPWIELNERPNQRETAQSVVRMSEAKSRSSLRSYELLVRNRLPAVGNRRTMLPPLVSVSGRGRLYKGSGNGQGTNPGKGGECDWRTASARGRRKGSDCVLYAGSLGD